MNLFTSTPRALALLAVTGTFSFAANAESKLIVQSTDAAACRYLQSVMSVAASCQQNVFAIAGPLDERVTAVQFTVDYKDKAGASVRDVQVIARIKGAPSVVYFRAVEDITDLRITAQLFSIAAEALTYP